MLIKKHHSFTVFCSVFFCTTTALAEVSIFSRSFSEDGQFYNTLITGKASKEILKPDDNSNNAQLFELSWSRVTEGEQLQICFPSAWSVPEQATGLKVLYSNVSQQEKSDCKHLLFNESGGRQSVLVAASNDQKKSVRPTFYGLDFSGIVALKPIVESQPRNVRPQQPLVPQNNTQALARPVDNPAPKTLIAGSSGGPEMYDPFDKKRPPFPFLPNVGSEIVLSLINSFLGEGSYIRVNILLATGESIQVTLSGEEVLALKKAGALTNHRRLISYLKRRQHWLNSWFTQRDTLESVLGGINPDPDARYIQNLIDDLNDMTVVITPDNPENGNIPVSGILNAMGGGKTGAGAQGAGKTRGNQASSASGGLRHRKLGTQGSGQTPDENSDGADGKKPEQTGSAENSDMNPRINIRDILGRSNFSAFFEERVDFILTGLYVYGQLIVGQLMDLLDYNATTESSNLDSPITSDRLIEILEAGDEASKIRSLQVLHALARMLPEAAENKYHATILLNTPEELVDWVMSAPDIPAGKTPEELFRLLANELVASLLLNLPDRELTRRVNALSRAGFIPGNSLRGRFSRKYSLALFVVTNHGMTQARGNELITFMESKGYLDFTINERLKMLLGRLDHNAQHGLSNAELASVADNVQPAKEELVKEDPVNTDSGEGLSNEDMVQRVAEIYAYLRSEKITEETIDLMNQYGLFDEVHIQKICINEGQGFVIVQGEALKLLEEFNSQHKLALNQDRASDVLRQANYSNEAIDYLREKGYLRPETCELLIKACDPEQAASVAKQLTHKYRIFNTVLASQKMSFPELSDQLRTYDEWAHIDSQGADYLQKKEIIDSYGLNYYVDWVAERMACPEKEQSPEDLNWDIAAKVRRTITGHDRRFERLTNESAELPIIEAIKFMARMKMVEIKKKKAEQQRKIDEGTESWCEWLTRILLS